jgi:hypothetical protein
MSVAGGVKPTMAPGITWRGSAEKEPNGREDGTGEQFQVHVSSLQYPDQGAVSVHSPEDSWRACHKSHNDRRLAAVQVTTRLEPPGPRG